MIDSPCIAICKLDSSQGHCIGCGRTLEEIGQWRNASAAWQQDVVTKSRNRLEKAKNRKPGLFGLLLPKARPAR